LTIKTGSRRSRKKLCTTGAGGTSGEANAKTKGKANTEKEIVPRH